MSTESTHFSQKLIEYQEAGLALRAVELARRIAITFFGVSTIALLGFIYSRSVQSDTCAYLCLAGILLSFMSYNLFVRYTKTIQYIREHLLMLQDATGSSLYSGVIRAGFSERNFYRFIYILVGGVFLITSVLFLRDANARNHLIFQSCGPYAEIAIGDVDDACPCGRYPPPNDIQPACTAHHTPTEKQATCPATYLHSQLGDFSACLKSSPSHTP